MNEVTYTPVNDWSMGRCPSCGETIAILTAVGGSQLRIRLSDQEVFWLKRRHHPAYAHLLQPLLERLLAPTVQVELRESPPGGLVCMVRTDGEHGLLDFPVSPALALMMFEATGLPLVIDDSLFGAANEHFEDVMTRFASFISTISPQDFETAGS